MIDDAVIARALHVLFVAHWFGGVAFVTLVALPLARARRDAREGLGAVRGDREPLRRAGARLDSARRRDADCGWRWRLDLWRLFGDAAFWWMDAMVALWALFMAIVFVVEPLAHKRISAMAARDPAALLIRLSRAHRVLLAAGIVTIFAAVVGAHGGMFG